MIQLENELFNHINQIKNFIQKINKIINKRRKEF